MQNANANAKKTNSIMGSSTTTNITQRFSLSSPSLFLSQRKMHRSSSTPRISDEFFINSSSSPSQTLKQQSSNNTDQDHQQLQLPTYNPLSHVAMKERSRLRSAENAIHIIPLVLLLCVIILWFFSNSETKL